MNKRHLYPTISFLVILSTLLAACGPGASLDTAKSNIRRENPAIQEADLAALVEGNNAFAMDLYRTLRTENGNLILSPYSISLALAMTYVGARGETEAQMASTLHFAAQDQLHPAFNALDQALEKESVNLDKDQEPFQLDIANGVWAEQTQPFEQEFLDTLAKNYGAGINLADFKTQFEPTRKQINDWVSDQTEDKIKDLLPQDSLNPDTRMVLVNAIYFKADWLDQFDANSTGEDSFYLLDGSEIQVDMMRQNMYIPYFKGEGYQAVELPYAGDTAAMTILLPDEGTFEDFESALTSEQVDEAIASMQPTSAILNLPKFKYDSSFNLNSALEKMGMSDAFNRNKADFSSMTGKPDLFISNVIHKAFVAVDEEGTEAAAATAVIMEAAGAPMSDVVLEVNRPFIFILRDKVSGQILFIGRVLNPQ